MGLNVKNLAQGTVSSVSSGTPTTLYPSVIPTTATGTVIKSIALSNVLSADVRINLKMRPAPGTDATNDCYIAPKDLLIPAGGQVIIDATFTLTAGPTADKIIGWLDTGNANGIAYVISGIERDN